MFQKFQIKDFWYKRNQRLFRLNQNFKKSIGFLKMDIFKMSKTENLNKVSKKKSEFSKWEANALKIIFLLKKCVTITFFKIVGTKLSIQMYPLLGYYSKVQIKYFKLCNHNSLGIFYTIFEKLCILCSKSSRMGILYKCKQ